MVHDGQGNLVYSETGDATFLLDQHIVLVVEYFDDDDYAGHGPCQGWQHHFLNLNGDRLVEEVSYFFDPDEVFHSFSLQVRADHVCSVLRGRWSPTGCIEPHEDACDCGALCEPLCRNRHNSEER